MKHKKLFEVLILSALLVCLSMLVVIAISVRKEMKLIEQENYIEEETELLAVLETEDLTAPLETDQDGDEIYFDGPVITPDSIEMDETAEDLDTQLQGIYAYWEGEPGFVKDPSTSGLRVFIGDSRTVGMQRSVKCDPSRDVFICKGGENYQYFEGEAVPQLERLIAETTVSEVFINMGVNDAANNCKGWEEYTVHDYVALINSLILKYPLVEFYFFSVGPVDGGYHGTRIIEPEELNPYIDDFNMVMKEFCGAFYIDTAEYIKKNHLKTADGVHYGAEVNQMIYDYVIQY